MSAQKRSNVKIVSDGTAQGTKVFVGDEYIRGLTKIEIMPFRVGETVEAKLTVEMTALKIEAKDIEIETTDILIEDLVEGYIREVLLSFDALEGDKE